MRGRQSPWFKSQQVSVFLFPSLEDMQNGADNSLIIKVHPCNITHWYGMVPIQQLQ